MVRDADKLPARYRNARLIGRGGMGEIYLATDEALGREVAVKVLSEAYASDEDVRERFKREALAAARLSGEPNAVTIFDVGEHDGRPFIVMEHMPGGSLADRLKAGTPALADALDWLEQSARALDAAHARGIVHRDVKPGNLLLDDDGHVHVADFGVASAAGLASMTRTGTVLGTAGYLAPEQARGERATSASDRYALAVVAWELLTGRRPFAAETPTAEAAAHATASVPPISEERSDLPADLDPVFRRALAKDPSVRHPTSYDFVHAVREAVARGAATTNVVAAVPPTAATRVATAAGALPPRRRRNLALPLGLAALAALVIGGIALAAAFDGDGDEGAQTVVTTVETTLPGTTVERPVTVTEEAPPPPPQPEPQPPPSPPASVGEAREVVDESTALMGSGDYEGALALAQSALETLEGTGDTYEGYANFNVGNSLAHLDRCDEALPYLQRRLDLLGPHPDVTAAQQRCGVGGGEEEDD